MKNKSRNISLALITILGLSSVGVSVYFLVDYFKPQYKLLNVYNEIATNLSQSNDQFDTNALNSYKTITTTMVVQSSQLNAEMGTIWNYGFDEVTKTTYFATNIHVIGSALYGTVEDGFNLKAGSSFLAKSPFQSSVFELNDLQIVKISIRDKTSFSSSNSGTLSNPTNPWYSDFVVLSTKTQLFAGLPRDLGFMGDGINDDEEYDWLKNGKLSDKEFYICGYPAAEEKINWPDIATWTTVKYKWIEGFAYHDKKPMFSSAAKMMADYLSQENTDGQKILTSQSTNNARTLYKNYSEQLLLPMLNMKGGSSGSLVSVKYPNKDGTSSLLAIGIYWGVYAADLGGGNLTDPYIGGVDLFYARNHEYLTGKDTIKISYNNLPKI